MSHPLKYFLLKLPSCFTLFLYVLSTIFLFAGCEREDDVIAITFFSTAEPSLSPAGVISGGEMRANREIGILEYGVCYSTSPAPSVDDNIAPGTELSESWEQNQYLIEFTSLITGLTSGTKYYIRAFVTTRTGSAYGNQVEFTF